MYGMLVNESIVDDRIREVTYHLDETKSLVATVPHFWTSAEMDPNYSILINDKSLGRKCATKSHKTTYIIIGVVVGFFVICGILFAIIVLPRLQVFRKVQRAKKRKTMEDSNEMSYVRSSDSLTRN
eukprot:Phypoly_transcript_17119.p1 GENE.Phypoly_transcript_17119~~Phypoly_transcript_17119.p1  ORF type:complete len:126 (+),score=16.74 Phypoly_transcript_17119:442-819(+)